MTWRPGTSNEVAIMAFLTIQHSENNSAGLHCSLLGATNSIIVFFCWFSSFILLWGGMQSLIKRLPPIRTWNDKPVDISQENWKKIQSVYRNPGETFWQPQGQFPNQPISKRVDCFQINWVREKSFRWYRRLHRWPCRRTCSRRFGRVSPLLHHHLKLQHQQRETLYSDLIIW